MGLEEAAHAEPVRRAENDTHPIVESDKDDATVDATVPKRSVNEQHCLCQTTLYKKIVYAALSCIRIV